MEIVTLNRIAELTIGKNITRLKDKEEDIYTPIDFENDLHSENKTYIDNMCIMNLIHTKAAPLSDQTSKKCLTTNFILCSFDNNKLDPWYFCYLFNEDKYIKQQLNKFNQGTTLNVKRLSIKNIGELKIKLLSIEKQKNIGMLYKKFIIQNDLMKKQIDNYYRIEMELLRRIGED